MKPLMNLKMITSYLLLMLLYQLAEVEAFAAWLKCYVDLDSNEVIMNQPVVVAEESPYDVVVELKEEASDEWTTNPTFPNNAVSTFQVRLRVPPELKNQDVQYVVESTTGATFKGGVCEGRRASAIGHDRTVVLQVSGKEQTVEIWGGWALGHEAVKLTPRTKLRRLTNAEL